MNTRLKILIIEDNRDIQELYKIFFEDAWFEVFSALDWLKWISDMVEVNPDLVLLDLMMPQMNWYEVLETIKNLSSMTTPIIVCSNLSQKSDIDKAYKSWADLYLTKSDYEWSAIVDKVKEFLKEKRILN